MIRTNIPPYPGLYDLLGITPEVSAAEIRKAYLQRAKSLHPDTGNGDEELMKAINHAKEILLDEESRTIYDKGYVLEEEFVVSFDEWDDDNEQPASASKGEDLHVSAKISAKVAYLGGEKTISIDDGGAIRNITIVVPANSKTGKKLRVEGRGKRGPTGLRGDLYVELLVSAARKPAKTEFNAWLSPGLYAALRTQPQTVIEAYPVGSNNPITLSLPPVFLDHEFDFDNPKITLQDGLQGKPWEDPVDLIVTFYPTEDFQKQLQEAKIEEVGGAIFLLIAFVALPIGIILVGIFHGFFAFFWSVLIVIVYLATSAKILSDKNDI